jgi:hypothetical protein
MRLNVRSGVRLGTMVLLGALSACGSDDPTDIGNLEGSYTATVSGAVNQSLSGVAIFGSGTDPESSEQAWITYLTTDAQTGLAGGQSISFFGLGAPQARTYILQDLQQSGEFPDGEAVGMVILYTGQTLSGLFYSTAGALTVTSVSADQMNGTFTFTAEGLTFPPGGQPVQDIISVTGTFQASGGQFLVPPIG